MYHNACQNDSVIFLELFIEPELLQMETHNFLESNIFVIIWFNVIVTYFFINWIQETCIINLYPIVFFYFQGCKKRVYESFVWVLRSSKSKVVFVGLHTYSFWSSKRTSFGTLTISTKKPYKLSGFKRFLES